MYGEGNEDNDDERINCSNQRRNSEFQKGMRTPISAEETKKVFKKRNEDCISEEDDNKAAVSPKYSELFNWVDTSSNPVINMYSDVLGKLYKGMIWTRAKQRW